MLTDRAVFDDEHLPRRLLHREGAVTTLMDAWSRTRYGSAGDEILLAGPSGVGKTALARHTLDRLADRVSVAQAYVPCLGATPATVLRTVCRTVGVEAARTDPADRLQARLIERLDRPAVVILDEADGLPGSEALRLLADIGAVSTVVITHHMDHWLARAEHTHDRYLSATHLHLDRYGVTELADILEARADAGLPPDAVSRGQLERIADDVAGVAREGIQALRAAAMLAAERGRGTITDADVDDAYERARHRIRQANLQSLPYHHQVLYAILHETEGLAGAALHDRYDAIAESAYANAEQTPITKRSRRNKLKKLIAYDLVAREGPDHDPTYVPVDEAVAPAIEIACDPPER
jgi:Cdc6-like AAA superfamily ATPase